MNINNSQNKNHEGIKYVTQEQIDKMSYNEKFIGCKCGKKPEFRWKPSDLTIHKGKGLFYGIIPYKGPNGEEVCCKCAKCVKCGGEKWSYKEEKTNDNISGDWAIAYCQDCFNGTEKPSLPKKEPWQGESCNYCGKLTKIKFANSPTEKTFCSRDCFVAAGNKIQKGKCRIAGCSREAYYECMDLCLGHSKPCRGAECNLALGTDEGDFCERCGKGNKNNSPSPNPAIPNSQPITNSNEKKDKSDNSVKVNPGNSPQPNPEKSDYSFEIKLNSPADNQKNSLQTKPNEAKKENNNKVLVVNLKDIKKISLVGDNLIIEFNQSEQSQTVVSEQISSSQELSAAKKYLQTNHRSTMNSQELANVISQQKDKGVNNSPTQPSKSPFLWMAGVGVIGVMVGLCVGLVVKVKKLRPKKK